MTNYLYIMIGGALGAASRYAISQLLAGIRVSQMPIGTITVNLLGCLLLGVLTAIGERHLTLPLLTQAQTQQVLPLLSVGFCGAFTTFSTFCAEGTKAMQSGIIASSLVYLMISVTLGCLLFWWGRTIA